MDGLTVAACLGKTYLNAKGEGVKYKLADLKYDIKGLRLELVGGSAVEGADALLSGMRTPSSSKRSQNLRSQEKNTKRSKAWKIAAGADGNGARARPKGVPTPARALGQDSSSDSSTESDSSSSASDESAGKGVAHVVAGPPSSAPRPRPRTTACAKMLVRVGLRCSCHFMYVRECPALASPTPRQVDFTDM